jgi:hypothetical protein
MMTEAEIRGFVDEATSITGDHVSVTERITARWLQDREEATREAAGDVYDEYRDGFYGIGGLQR